MSDLYSLVDWSRAQFALTALYHWLFVPLTLGLGLIVSCMETIYYRTRDERWKQITQYWMNLFGVNFALGIATGIILEFQFGTNWSNYSWFVGDIFGAPLAIEGILAFFLESTFIAVMFFGWRKVSRGFHLTATWLTAFGANLSAWWILVANSWMQYPVGCDFNLETVRNEMTSFSAVALSPVAVNKFFHTVTSSFVLAALFVVGVSAWYLLRRREQLMARRSIAIASAFGFVFALVTAFTGDRSGAIVARVQPMKLAAMEALYDGEEGAPLTVVGLLRPEGQRLRVNCDFQGPVEVEGNPSLLSSVFRNLADNAAAYSGGRDIFIRLLSDTAEACTILFADNGIGVDEEHLPHLFERFYRIDKGRSRKLGGTGLGLSIVKNAVVIHGGTNTVRNGERGGLEFVFTLRKHS